jgi:hypothetical protein
MKAALLALILLCLAVGPLTAQEDDAGWPIVERCVGAPTTPPAGWTFEGTILMSGDYGLHAIDAKSETPYILAFVPDSEYETAPGGGKLSPDKQWYAVIEGSVQRGNFAVVSETGIRIHSTVQLSENQLIEWENDYGILRTGWFSQLYWLDNDHLVYKSNIIDAGGPYLINRLTGEAELWQEPYLSVPTREFYPSSDWNSVVYHEPPNWFLYQNNESSLLDRLPSEYSNYVLWTSDETHFVAIAPDNEEQNLSFYDRQGQLLDTLYTAPPSEGNISISASFFNHTTTIGFSSDNRYLAFLLDRGERQSVYLADFEENQIVDLCTEAFSLAWSPSNDLLALLSVGENNPIRVVDITASTQYVVGYHRNYDYRHGILGWRAD